MRPLSAMEIARRQRTAVASLKDTCTIVRTGSTSDGAGGETPTTSVQADIPCRLSVVRGDEEQGAVQIVERGSYALTVPFGTDIVITDTVLALDRTFNVVWTPATSDYRFATHVGLEEIS